MITSKRALTFLRISFGIYFLWVGFLKLFANSPSLDLLQGSIPSAIGYSQAFTLTLSFVEILIGMSYLSNKLDRIASIVMIVSVILVSIPVFVFQGFDPRFPVLSLGGEYVLKNLILVAGGAILLSEKENPKSAAKAPIPPTI
jgi:uncharacterized membrane protein YkgB